MTPRLAPAATERLPKSVIGRAFLLLGAFSPREPELTTSELSARTGLAISTAHRLAVELQRAGALERTGMRFRPCIRLFELGQLARQRRVLREAALPFMEDLYEATHHTVHLGVLDGAEVVYIERLTGKHGGVVPSTVGGRNPAHCTGVGKALLAYLPPAERRPLLTEALVGRTPHSITESTALVRELDLVTEQGAAYDQEEAQIGLGCVAAPILDRRRRAVAALSVTGPVETIDRAALTPAVRMAALGVARTLTRADERRLPSEKRSQIGSASRQTDSGADVPRAAWFPAAT